MFQQGWLMAATVAMLSCSPTDTQVPPAQDATKRIARGREVFAEQKCQACHSVGQTGNRRSPLDGVGDKLSEDDIRKWIVSPRVMNPRVTKRAFDNLPKDDLDALVAYLKQLRRKPPGA